MCLFSPSGTFSFLKKKDGSKHCTSRTGTGVGAELGQSQSGRLLEIFSDSLCRKVLVLRTNCNQLVASTLKVNQNQNQKTFNVSQTGKFIWLWLVSICSCRWSGPVWRSWAGGPTSGLRMWGWLDIQDRTDRTLETAYGGEININGHRLWWTFLSQHAANCTLSQNLQHLWHCVVWKNSTF